MLTWSARRRLIYIAIALVIVAIVVVSFLIINKPEISCSDGKKNGDEVGVDCGGSCFQVCSSEILPLKVSWYRLFDLGPGKYDVAALVKNPNTKHSATKARYIFRLWDKDNLLINSKEGEAFINPKEDLVIFESRVDVGKKIPVKVAFEFDDQPIWQKVERNVPALTFSDKRFENEPFPRLVATIKNDSLATVKEIGVSAIVSNADQNAVAVSSTFLEELPGGESREVSFTWPAPLVDAAAFIDLSAHFDWRKLPVPAPANP